jgi:hypothetical protein
MGTDAETACTVCPENKAANLSAGIWRVSKTE